MPYEESEDPFTDVCPKLKSVATVKRESSKVAFRVDNSDIGEPDEIVVCDDEDILRASIYSIDPCTNDGKKKSYLRLLLDFYGYGSSMALDAQKKEWRILEEALKTNGPVSDKILKPLYQTLFDTLAVESDECSLFGFFAFVLSDGGLDALPSDRFLKEARKKQGQSGGYKGHENRSYVLRAEALRLADIQRDNSSTASPRSISGKIHSEVQSFAKKKGLFLSPDPFGALYTSWINPYLKIREEACRLADEVRKSNNNITNDEICDKIFMDLNSFASTDKSMSKMMEQVVTDKEYLLKWI
ncbi:hypothetical protein [Mariprofundus ferrooxydans]|uniref:Uncharacterized protein n=1 Tax=Mariprofundus ferrooxydans PV-1 TaxID=314345 RepID=Q0F0R7_9PROT|nr:hypothetical protein [Mariprofundus ferrooxydans]EAU54961.1 hypothetical protein SPV1_06449 [Mariprofundus ferrooxydans PV-1]